MESPLPLVTIGIPFYNEEVYLKAALDSVLAQRYGNIRIIVSDNCSTDASSRIARTYADRDKRIQLFRHEVNKGPAFNFKFVLDEADSKYFVWIGGHDIFLPNYIEDAVQLLEARQDVVLAYPKTEEIDQNDVIHGEITTDYDTVGLSTPDALIKIAKNFHNGYVIHGVFRMQVLKKLPFEKVTASDILMVFVAATYGAIANIPTLGFRRRTVRHETHEQQTERHVQQGIYKKADNPFELMFVVLAKHLLKTRALTVFEKVRVLRQLRLVFARRFKIRLKGLAKTACGLLVK